MIVNGVRACHTPGTVKHVLAAVSGTVQRTIRRYAMIDEGDRILVAVSGGSDSVGLLVILHALRRKLDIDLVVGHVNHGLRGEASDADQECAAAAAARLHVPFVHRVLPQTLARGGNLEARARELRYAALLELAAERDCRRIATGHTRDDQAETVLLRLIRGAGPGALGGIQAQRRDGVIRPLIACTRSEVVRVAGLAGLEYRSDCSNEDPRFQRTHVRHRLLPLMAELNPSIRRSLASSAAQLQAHVEIIDAWAEGQLMAVAPHGKLSVAALAAVPPMLRGHVVQRWLVREGVVRPRLMSRHIDAVMELAAGARGGGAVRLPGDLRVRRLGAHLVLCAVSSPGGFASRPLGMGREVHLPGGWCLVARSVECAEGSIPLPDNLWSAVCDLGSDAHPLTVRTAAHGERVRPLGLGGSRKLSDVFSDRKIPADERWIYPVVESGGEILWIPGVVRSEARRITGSSRKGMWLRATRSR